MAKKKILKRGKSKKQDFVIEIEDNALGSLKHGIEHFISYEKDPSDLKFALIHVFHSVELYLKARLAQDHPLLIFSKPECSISDEAHTVGFDTLVARLRNAQISLSKEDLECLDFIKRIRNAVEHHRIKANEEEVRNHIGKAARFLERFLKDQLSIVLQDELDAKIYKPLKEAIYTYKERLEEAKKKIQNYLPKHNDDVFYTIESCPECWEDTIPMPSPASHEYLAYCFFCKNKFYYKSCDRCGRHSFSSSKFTDRDDDIGMCEDCWEEMMNKD